MDQFIMGCMIIGAGWVILKIIGFKIKKFIFEKIIKTYVVAAVGLWLLHSFLAFL